MILSVEPTSGRASAETMIVDVVSKVGVTVTSWIGGRGRSSARLEIEIAIPTITQKATRTM
jgi:hypothetical protein